MKKDIKQLDKICREQTGFNNFADMVGAHQAYRPSIDRGRPGMVTLGEAWDDSMAERCDERRCYYYGHAQVTLDDVQAECDRSTVGYDMGDLLGARDYLNSPRRCEDFARLNTWQVSIVNLFEKV